MHLQLGFLVQDWINFRIRILENYKMGLGPMDSAMKEEKYNWTFVVHICIVNKSKKNDQHKKTIFYFSADFIDS
jgi:hypothetical protein